MIKQKSYGDAMKLIANILDTYSKVTLWIDPEIQGLQLEVKALSLQLSSLEDELSDIEKLIYEFEVRHSQELGDIILQILEVKKMFARQKMKQEPNNEEAKIEFKEAENDERTFRDNFEEIQKNKRAILSEEQERELKLKFRKISKLTHPDVVDAKYAEEAAKLFIKAKEAKDRNDLQTINEILDYLENGALFKQKHQTITEIEQLRAEAINLRFKIKQLLQKISQIKTTEAYRTIEEIKDWNTYFNSAKIHLEEELQRLRKLFYEYQ